jgi:hypothetical protein
MKARAIIRKCMHCRLQKKVMHQQIMGEVPAAKLIPAPPFTETSMDQFGPIQVKDPSRGRRQFPCWGTAFICLGTRSVALYATPGSSSAVFLDTLTKFTSTYGAPLKIHTDHAPQAVCATSSFSWKQVRETSGFKDIEWCFTAKGSSWRNSNAERCIKAVRHTLHHVIRSYQGMDFNQLDSALHKVTYLLNERPLAVRMRTEEDYYSVTPNDILLGRSARAANRGSEEFLEADEEACNSLDAQTQLVQEWWERWSSQYWSLLVPRTRWTQEHRPVEVGDVCCLAYTKKFSPPAYRLCRVTRVMVSSDGKIRTAEVAMRKKDGRGGPKYRVTPVSKIIVGVQRLACLLPKLEQRVSEGQKSEEQKSEDQMSEEQNKEGSLGGETESDLPPHLQSPSSSSTTPQVVSSQSATSLSAHCSHLTNVNGIQNASTEMSVHGPRSTVHSPRSTVHGPRYTVMNPTSSHFCASQLCFHNNNNNNNKHTHYTPDQFGIARDQLGLRIGCSLVQMVEYRG